MASHSPMHAPIPPLLVPEVNRHIANWQAAAGTPLDAVSCAVFTCSEFVARACLREPELITALDGSESLLQLPAQLPADERECMALLRQARNREMSRITWRDLIGAATLDETLSDLSLAADTLIAAALDWAGNSVAEAHGVVRDADGSEQTLVVIAMGKLGGGELNFSSDVDLVFLYPESGTSDGRRPLDSDSYFARVGQRLIRLLDQKTGDGFVYRVDTRLRPLGSSGAIAISYAAFETYLQQHGREWERYAYVKARPLTGTAAARDAFFELVRPFVYRRYLDYGVLESLREMKALIAADVGQRERENDIKLGAGGIREIEFIVQSFQLMRGGADPGLRQQSLLNSLKTLAQRGWFDAAAADELAGCYRYLRRLENRLQMWRDEQVCTLPVDDAGKARITFAMGHADNQQFAQELARIRQLVSGHFEAVVPMRNSDEDVDLPGAHWKADPGSHAALAQLEQLDFNDPAALQRQLVVLRDSGQYLRLDERGRGRLDALIPRILRLAGGRADGDAVVARLLGVVTAIGGRSAYFALLTENPVVLERCADLCSASPWLARQVAQHPLLLDELIDPRIFEAPPTRADLETDLQQRFQAIAADDLERQMEALRMFQQVSAFRIAVADLSGVLPLMKVSDRLSDTAELVLQKTTELARQEMQRRYGVPRCNDSRRAGFAIIGYGKLGGLELGYASDLDLVMLHDSDGDAQQCDGDQGLDNARYFARLGQRILHMLSTTTPTGVLYEVDTRLRPSGKGGPLVSSIVAFAGYQREHAWTWEHQALLRARPVAGDTVVCSAFDSVRREILTRQRNAEELRADVLAMRQRMRRDLPGGGTGAFHIKRDAGGLTDIEFLVQYWVLANAHQTPRLIEWSDNIRQLESLAAAGVCTHTLAAELTDIYRRYRQCLHHRALADEDALVPAEQFAAERERVRSAWGRVFGD
ncbi:MAG: bifunctional [glutamate--ammonia ligase]-adenylyl-L-tyrosine phosphorylase/[glutamate--ammonia-ligase] adenylyltransferase [Gammaproteobacteria bacterium]|nr:bifunctional [glutamate--ammonia ligase]-adenylyl-L-tyrosine phosphorylase/[glutamate--ammonia-ligase] adenylyltransferase [Gammaproteobacteria bacterium]